MTEHALVPVVNSRLPHSSLAPKEYELTLSTDKPTGRLDIPAGLRLTRSMTMLRYTPIHIDGAVLHYDTAYRPTAKAYVNNDRLRIVYTGNENAGTTIDLMVDLNTAEYTLSSVCGIDPSLQLQITLRCYAEADVVQHAARLIDVHDRSQSNYVDSMRAAVAAQWGMLTLEEITTLQSSTSVITEQRMDRYDTHTTTIRALLTDDLREVFDEFTPLHTVADVLQQVKTRVSDKAHPLYAAYRDLILRLYIQTYEIGPDILLTAHYRTRDTVLVGYFTSAGKSGKFTATLDDLARTVADYKRLWKLVG